MLYAQKPGYGGKFAAATICSFVLARTQSAAGVHNLKCRIEFMDRRFVI
jgi:hypothetical protein